MPEDLSNILQTRSMTNKKAITEHFGIFGHDPYIRQVQDRIQIRGSSHQGRGNGQAGAVDLPTLVC